MLSLNSEYKINYEFFLLNSNHVLKLEISLRFMKYFSLFAGALQTFFRIAFQFETFHPAQWNIASQHRLECCAAKHVVVDSNWAIFQASLWLSTCDGRVNKQKKENFAEFLIAQTFLIVARTINQAFRLTASCNVRPGDGLGAFIFSFW